MAHDHELDEMSDVLTPKNRSNMSREDQRRLREIRAVLDNMEGREDGMLRITELFEARRPRGRAIVTPWTGTVVAIEKMGVRRVIIQTEAQVNDDIIHEHLGEDVFVGPAISRRDADLPDAWLVGTVLTAGHLRRLRDAGIGAVLLYKGILVPARGALLVRIGDEVRAGDRLTPGPLDPHEILAAQGPAAVLEYMVSEIQRVYKAQGVDIHDKHIEVIVRQMLRRQRVVSPGDTEFHAGQIVDRWDWADAVQAAAPHAERSDLTRS